VSLAYSAFLVPILPDLFFMRSFFWKPDCVFSLLPKKTADLALLPLAITLTFLAFMLLMLFTAFMDAVPLAAVGFFIVCMGNATWVT